MLCSGQQIVYFDAVVVTVMSQQLVTNLQVLIMPHYGETTTEFTCTYSLVHNNNDTFLSSGIARSQMMPRHSMGTLHFWNLRVESKEETRGIWCMHSFEF